MINGWTIKDDIYLCKHSPSALGLVNVGSSLRSMAHFHSSLLMCSLRVKKTGFWHLHTLHNMFFPSDTALNLFDTMWKLSERWHVKKKLKFMSRLWLFRNMSSKVRKGSNLLRMNSVTHINATYSNYIIITKCCKCVIGIISVQKPREAAWLLKKYRANCCQQYKSNSRKQ